MRRRGLAAAVTAILAAAALAGCGAGGGRSADTLDVWVYQDASDKVQQAAADEFNRTATVKVRLNRVPGDGYQDKLRTAMGSPNAPDVFFNWGGGSIADYVAAGRVLDLGPTLAADPALKRAFLPSVLDAGTVDGRYYGIPMRGTQPVLLFYNKDVFARAGVEPPRTWDDLLRLVDTFKARGITPFALAGANSWTEQMWLEYLLDRIGGAEVFRRIQSGDAAAWGDPAVVQAAERVRRLVDRGAFGPSFGSVDYPGGGASTLFSQGRAAMHLMGSWEYANQLSNAPRFARSGLGYTAFPVVPGGKGDPANVVGNPTNYWSISSRSKHREAALAFAELAASPKYATDLIANGDVPTTANVASLLGRGPDPAYARYQYDLVRRAPSFTLSWDQALPAGVATPMLTEIQKLFAGQLGARQFADAMRARR
jgi:xylobiose transport system substrate-binding protein